MRTAPSGVGERGFTMVEVMVAMFVLLVGVLGTVTMIDSANGLTSRNKSREGATALGRSVMEIARGIPYKQLNATQLVAELQDRDGFEDVKTGVAGHQIESEGFVYTVAPTICSMDDPADGLGAHVETGVAFCSDSDATTSPTDRNADDYRRVSIQLTWVSSGHAQATAQRGIVSNPVGGLGPTVTVLNATTPATTNITTSTTTAATYGVTTSSVAEGVGWTVNGAGGGSATSTGGLTWSFTWDLGPTDAPLYYDCTYVVQAEAFDDQDRSGAPKALTVTLNRRQAFAPPSFLAGRNLNGNLVDISWAKNRECDVKGYKVYRGTTAATVSTLVCSVELGEPTSCIDDPGESATFPLYYQVVAIDTAPAGTDREGTRSAAIAVTDANESPPDAPTGLTVCTGGNPDCNDLDGDPASAGTAVLSWQPSTDPDGDGIDFYRIYRDGETYADRLDVFFPVADKPLVYVDSSVTGSHTYRVSAVDTQLGESELSEPVTWD